MPRTWPVLRDPRDIREGLVLDFPFDYGDTISRVFDRSGYGNNGTIYGATWIDTEVGKALSFDGVDDYVVITPFTVYGWSEITIEEWLYAVWPKANTSWSKFSMIGDFAIDYPSTFNYTDGRTDYTSLRSAFEVRRPDGSRYDYTYNFIAWRNQWVHLVRRFTSGREFSVWVNGVKRYYVTVPAEEKTVLEWNPDTATYPEYYKRFVLGANISLCEWMKMMQGMLRIYNRALTAEEIRRRYEISKPRPWPRITTPVVR